MVRQDGSRSYLGYKFSVFEPEEKVKTQYRKVVVDVADEKLAKIKKRIVRTLMAFVRDRDLQLLRDRLRLLASNFTITDVNTGRKILTGIYYGYPRLTTTSSSMNELDCFMRRALLSGKGRLFAQVRALLSAADRRVLLGISFKRGSTQRRYVHFHPKRIKVLQECWIHE